MATRRRGRAHHDRADQCGAGLQLAADPPADVPPGGPVGDNGGLRPGLGRGIAALADQSHAQCLPEDTRDCAQMQNMIDGGIPAMMWGMGLVWVLVVIVLVLGIAALVKYLFFGGRR